MRLSNSTFGGLEQRAPTAMRSRNLLMVLGPLVRPLDIGRRQAIAIAAMYEDERDPDAQPGCLNRSPG